VATPTEQPTEPALTAGRHGPVPRAGRPPELNFSDPYLGGAGALRWKAARVGTCGSRGRL